MTMNTFVVVVVDMHNPKRNVCWSTIVEKKKKNTQKKHQSSQIMKKVMNIGKIILFFGVDHAKKSH